MEPSILIDTTLGKYRHLGRCSTEAGHFVVLAIDHRENLLRLLNKAASVETTPAAFTAFKASIVDTLRHTASALLIDPAYGIGTGISTGTITGRLGLLSPVEVTDYDAHPSQRDTVFIPGWSVEKIKRVGGDGVKLLLPYHPDGEKAAAHRATVERIVEACARHDIPFFLEPIPYSLDPTTKLPNDELRQVSVENARLFSRMGVDVLKVPFPLDAKQSDDLDEWRAACEELNTACEVPWALLSAGVTFDVFAKQAEIACQAGASGVIVGRAVWAEAVSLQGDDRQAFVTSTALQRMQQLMEICTAHAVPWMQRVKAPAVTTDWYQNYSF